jgi:hypothetical protein
LNVVAGHRRRAHAHHGVRREPRRSQHGVAHAATIAAAAVPRAGVHHVATGPTASTARAASEDWEDGAAAWAEGAWRRSATWARWADGRRRGRGRPHRANRCAGNPNKMNMINFFSLKQIFISLYYYNHSF